MAGRDGLASGGELVREHLERARAGGTTPEFMRLAGCVTGPKDLSTRKGFVKKRRGSPTRVFPLPLQIGATSIMCGPSP